MARTRFPGITERCGATGFSIELERFERSLLLGTLVLVLVVELLNSAIEATVDRISKKHHKLSGRAKGHGLGGVYLCLLLVITVWSSVLTDRLFP